MSILKYVKIAKVCHEQNKAYCEILGDYSQPLWRDASVDLIVSALQGVEAIAMQKVTSPKESHANWMEAKLLAGWKHGTKKHLKNKTHPCIVAFSALPAEQQLKDTLFFNTAKALLDTHIGVDSE